MIEELLYKRNMSPYRLSKISGIPYSTLSDIISGRTPLSSVSGGTIAKIAKALGISMDDLYYGRGNTEPIYLYSEGRTIHIVYEDLHFKYMGPKNFVAFKNINRVVDGCAHINTYFSDGKVIYLEEDYVDIKEEFADYGVEERYPADTDLRLGRPGDAAADRYTDEALMICDNMAILRHDSGTDDLEIEIINMTRQSARSVMRLSDYAFLSSSMSDTMERRVLSIVKRNDSLITQLAGEGGNTYA